MCKMLNLLPSGSEQHEVLLFGSISEGILQAHHLIVQIEENMLVYLGSKNKKHHRGSTQATIHPLAIMLTAALWALVSMIA